MSNPISHIFRRISQHAEDISYPYVLFGIYGIISFPLYHVIWIFLGSVGYDSLGLRLLAMVLCIPLLFYKRYPCKYRNIFNIYWYSVILYCFPFLFTLFLFKNNLSYPGVLNSLSILIQSILLLDMWALMVVLPLGIGLGFLAYYLTSDTMYLTADYSTIMVTYFSVVVFAVLFIPKREQLQVKRILREKLRGMSTISSCVAHELRTPILSIRSGVSGVKEFLPKLVETYKLAQAAGFKVPEIQSRHLKLLPSTLEDVEVEAEFANTIMNMLLVNLYDCSKINSNDFEQCSIADCTRDALQRYPFNPIDQQRLVDIQINQDFNFKGRKLLVIHVLFNLLKNALYYIEAAGKGQIHIWTEQHKKYNSLIFKDTGQGISAKDLPHIFDQFYGDTNNGTGIGLYFCKLIMQSLGGKIKCRSQAGEFTEFELHFPKQE